jgi:hypothetical protein
MSNAANDVHKVYVNQEGIAVLKCPSCEAVKTTTVDKFKGSKHVLKVKCTCKQTFMVELEFRKAYRKDIKLAGDFYHLVNRSARGRMMVINISKTGIGFQVLGAVKIREGNELQVSFNLDDKHNSLIDKKVVVRLVKNNYIGCEFTEKTSHDKALGFYLMV